MLANRLTLSMIAVGLLSQAGCKQPDLDCTSAHGTFAAKFDLKKGGADSPCGGLKVDILGMQTYFAAGGVNGTPKFAESTVAIRAQYLYDYVYGRLLHDADMDGIADADDNCWQTFNPDQVNTDMEPEGEIQVGDACTSNAPPSRAPIEDLEELDKTVGDPDSIGDFKVGTEGEFCSVPEMKTVTLKLPEVPVIPAGAYVMDDPETADVDETDPPADIPGQPASELRYEWENVKFLVTADAQGTQFAADLKFTKDGATCEYHVLAVYPDVGCEVDDDCHAEGSSLNPDFAVECREGLCVLKDELPAYE